MAGLGDVDLGSTARRTVALCGFMGAGKSSVGTRLARRIGRRFVDVDEIAVERLGESIAAAFAAGREAEFRRLEADIVADVLDGDPVVLSLGGGTYENPETRALLRARAVVVHLDQSFDDLAPAIARLRSTRPLLAGTSEDDIRALYERRRAIYLLADLTVAIPRSGVGRATTLVLEALVAFGRSATR